MMTACGGSFGSLGAMRNRCPLGQRPVARSVGMQNRTLPRRIAVNNYSAVESTDDVDAAARRHADGYACTIGAIGAPDRNFCNDAQTWQGFGDDVRAVQRLWRSGRWGEAAAQVPAELGRATNLLGTRRPWSATGSGSIATGRYHPAGQARWRLRCLPRQPGPAH